MKRVLALILFSGSATAHEWYPPECCHDRDCRIAHDGEIVSAPGGWRVVPTGETYTFRQARPSPDAHFHRCLSIPTDVRSKTLCLFTPVGGS